MKPASKFALIFVTVPDFKFARMLVKAALKVRLIACANIVPRVESHYWWRGKIETGGEVLILMKTIRARLAALEKFILAHHPYDTPEIVSVNLAAGTPRYLKWLLYSVEGK